MNELLLDRRDDGVVLLTLNRPDRRNAMTDGMTDEWQRTMAALAADRGVRCVVVTGAGNAFCAGGRPVLAGRSAGAEPVPALRDRMLAFYRTWLAITELEVPTIAAVNGAAVGAGLCLALACDLVTPPRTPSCWPRSLRSGCTPGWRPPTCCRGARASAWRGRCC